MDDKILLTEEMKLELSMQDGLQHRNRAEIPEYNYSYGDKYELAAQFQDVTKFSRRVEKPVLHLTIRLAPKGIRDRQKPIYLRPPQGYGPTHIHIVASRVGYDGRAARDSTATLGWLHFAAEWRKNMD